MPNFLLSLVKESAEIDVFCPVLNESGLKIIDISLFYSLKRVNKGGRKNKRIKQGGVFS